MLFRISSTTSPCRLSMRAAALAMAMALVAAAVRPAAAETILLTRGDGTFGLGWLFLDSSGTCRVATPRHVVEGADGNLSAPDLLDSYNRVHATNAPVAAADPDLDLAFLSVGGVLSRDGCSRDRIRATPLQPLIDGMKEAELGIATPTERQTITVALRAISRDDDGGGFIAFAPVDAAVSFQKGMSGGTVTSNGRPIAMLFEVDTENGIGIALRYDMIAAQLQKLTTAPESQAATEPPSGSDIVIERGRLIDQDAGLSAYLSGRSPLKVAPAPDRIVFTFDMDGRTVVRGMQLKTEGLPSKGSLIIEVDDSKGGFSPGARCALSADLSCPMSPRRATRLRVTLTGQESDRFAIRQLAPL